MGSPARGPGLLILLDVSTRSFALFTLTIVPTLGGHGLVTWPYACSTVGCSLGDRGAGLLTT